MTETIKTLDDKALAKAMIREIALAAKAILHSSDNEDSQFIRLGNAFTAIKQWESKEEGSPCKEAFDLVSNNRHMLDLSGEITNTEIIKVAGQYCNIDKVNIHTID